MEIKNFFDHFGILDFVVLYLDSSSTWKFVTFNKFCSNLVIHELTDRPNFSLIFPNKLNNLCGHPYRTVWTENSIRIFTHGKSLYGIDVFVLSSIFKHQNASLLVAEKLKTRSHRDVMAEVNEILNHGTADFCLNSDLTPPNRPHQGVINTYDEDGYCAVVPIPSSFSFIFYVLTPFDTLSWILMVAFTVAGGVLWRLFTRTSEDSSSAKDFIFAVIGNFLGQSVSLRYNRRILTTLSLLFFLMTFIMGNCYQSLIIASMTWSREGFRLKSFNEIYKSDYKFIVNDKLLFILNNSGEFSEFLDRVDIQHVGLSYEQLVLRKYVIIDSCFKIEAYMESDTQMPPMNFYFYKIPDMTMKHYEKLSIAERSPFYKRLQSYHDRIFESGIRQFLQKQIKFTRSSKRYLENALLKDEKYLLNIDDLFGIFYILLVSYLVATAIFLYELNIFTKLKAAVSKIRFRQSFQRRARVAPLDP